MCPLRSLNWLETGASAAALLADGNQPVIWKNRQNLHEHTSAQKATSRDPGGKAMNLTTLPSELVRNEKRSTIAKIC